MKRQESYYVGTYGHGFHEKAALSQVLIWSCHRKGHRRPTVRRQCPSHFCLQGTILTFWSCHRSRFWPTNGRHAIGQCFPPSARRIALLPYALLVERLAPVPVGVLNSKRVLPSRHRTECLRLGKPSFRRDLAVTRTRRWVSNFTFLCCYGPGPTVSFTISPRSSSTQ